MLDLLNFMSNISSFFGYFLFGSSVLSYDELPLTFVELSFQDFVCCSLGVFCTLLLLYFAFKFFISFIKYLIQ